MMMLSITDCWGSKDLVIGSIDNLWRRRCRLKGRLGRIGEGGGETGGRGGTGLGRVRGCGGFGNRSWGMCRFLSRRGF